jgi:CYTH domain-containing protein
MAKEIERKFLVKLVDGVLPSEIMQARCKLLTQGYLNLDKARQVRIRTTEDLRSYNELQFRAGKHAFITLKGKTEGITRDEFEFEIPFLDCLDAFKLCKCSLIEKVRSNIGRWEVDTFLGDNTGLFVAEIELSSEDEPFDRPDWLGEEVSKYDRYKNINLAVNPFCKWKEDGIEDLLFQM